MKRLFFKEILMISYREKKARKIAFHPQVTVIKGENDTGKSVLLKTLYRTLGAEPHQIHPVWENADVSSLLTFDLDGEIFHMLRANRSYCLFDKDGNLIQKFISITNELAPYFAKFFNFFLPLNSRGKQMQATPAFLFLPFYFDQDRSWQIQWKGFKRLEQFSNWKSDLIFFHCGIRPTEYYQAKSDKIELETTQKEYLLNRDVLQNTLDKFSEQLKSIQFDIDIDYFKKEIEELLKKSETLKKEEEQLKNQLIKLYDIKHVLLHQKNILKQSIIELSKDYKFATEKLDVEVECPTCGHIYKNSFVERFAIAQDEYRCLELLSEINQKLNNIEHKLRNIELKLPELRLRSRSIRELLEKKKGKLKFHDIIRSEGKKEVKVILKNELNSLDKEIGKLQVEIAKLNDLMAKFDNKERRQEVKQLYLSRIKNYMYELNVLNLSEKTFSRLDCVIKETGSDLPRALLAYYFAILSVISRYSTSTFCPVVLDSPKQQDIDNKNWERMLNFIKKNKPNNSQIILSVVDDLGIDMGGDTIILKNKYSLLSEDDFDEVHAKMAHFLNASL